MKPTTPIEIPLSGDVTTKSVLQTFNKLGEGRDGMREHAAMRSAQNNTDHVLINYVGDMSEEQSALAQNPEQWFAEHPEMLEALDI